MAFRVRKTEHNGAKHGRGALWGTKYEAKSQSGTISRRNSKAEIQEQNVEVRVSLPTAGQETR